MLSTETLGAPPAQKLQLLLNVAKANLVKRLSSNNINLTHHGAEGAVASLCSNDKGIANGQQQPGSCI